MLRRTFLLALAVVLAAAPAARALVVLEDGKSQLFVTGATEATWDSNVFSNATGRSDFYETARLGLDWERKAGIYAATLTGEWAYSHFQRLHEESSLQPTFSGALKRERGRLTGTADLGWREANESDNAANRRTRFREWNGRLDLRYPLNRRFALRSSATWEDRNYRDPTLYDHTIWSAALDVLRTYSSKLDFVAGYRFRHTALRGAETRTDHALLLGATGRILPRLEGDLRFGWQRRIEQLATARHLGAFTAAIDAWWSPRRWAAIGLQVSKDFSTTSTAASTDAFSAGLEAKFTAVDQFVLTGGTGYAHYRFYGSAGADRTDDNPYLRVGAEYPLTKRLKLTVSATAMHNHSTFAFADYGRRLINLGVSARY